MITVKEIKPNIFELVETIIGFTHDTKTSWYWDLDKKLLSESINFPVNMLTRPLTEADLVRFETIYKPLIIRRKPIDYENLDHSTMSHV